jgi:ATP-dependent Lhr-like helicase
VRGTHAFAALSEQEWRWALDFVTRGGQALRAYPQYARVVEENGRFRVASGVIERLHRMSIGTITSDAAVCVAFENGRVLGTIEESFIGRLKHGDRFVFAGRILEFLRLRNLIATVREADGRRGFVPRWLGGKSPLSTELAHAVRRKLDEARAGEWLDEEMRAVRPILELQAAWSMIPGSGELLVESIATRDGHHLFFFPFEGRAVHEGLAALIATRLTREAPRSIATTVTDYGVELLCTEALDLSPDRWHALVSTDRLVEDLLACLNMTGLARGRFRDIARVAGLIFSGYPGQHKTARQLQASSELFFDVFRDFDPSNLLLDQARREVLERELEVQRLRRTLERLAAMSLRIIEPPNLTPLSFPIWAESLRTQHVSSENWGQRVRRMVAQLEAAAEAEGGRRRPRLTPRDPGRPRKGSTPKKLERRRKRRALEPTKQEARV